MMLTTRQILLTTTLMLAFGLMGSIARAGQGDATKGAAVYTAQKCQMCHAIAGKGNKSNPLDGVGGKLSAEDIKQWITHPTEMAKKAQSTKKPPMPAKYGSLSAGDLDSLVAYMASLK